MLYPILISIFILLIVNLLLIYFTKKIFQVSKNGNWQVNISIVIAAKNEARNISKLLEALKNLDYPCEMYEVIIVDDNSTDNTFKELNSQIVSLKNFSAFELRNENKIGKREALSIGISKAKYPYILITDADCHPQKKWLKACSKNFSLGHDVLFGIAPFYQDEGFVNKISCFENLRSTFLSISMASIGLPYTAAARNFGFTKKAFEAIGGYSQTKDTISGDDDLFVREAVRKNLKIGIVTDSDSFVYSDTKKTFKEYLDQKARHTQTSLHYLKKHQLVLGFWHLLNLFFLLSPILMILNLLYAILIPAKLAIDFFINTFFQKRIGYKFSLEERIYLQFFYEVLLVVHFFNALFSKIKWK